MSLLVIVEVASGYGTALAVVLMFLRGASSHERFVERRDES